MKMKNIVGFCRQKTLQFTIYLTICPSLFDTATIHACAVLCFGLLIATIVYTLSSITSIYTFSHSSALASSSLRISQIIVHALNSVTLLFMLFRSRSLSRWPSQESPAAGVFAQTPNQMVSFTNIPPLFTLTRNFLNLNQLGLFLFCVLGSPVKKSFCRHWHQHFNP